jgi:hypothetical protein
MNILDIDTAKSYATEDNLIKALIKAQLSEMCPLIVRNRAGRFTAVFGLHISGLATSGDIMRAAREGFKTID